MTKNTQTQQDEIIVLGRAVSELTDAINSMLSLLSQQSMILIYILKTLQDGSESEIWFGDSLQRMS